MAGKDRVINISPMGLKVRGLRMLLEQCGDALANDCEMVTMGDGESYDALGLLRDTARSLTRTADKIVTMIGADIDELSAAP